MDDSREQSEVETLDPYKEDEAENFSKVFKGKPKRALTLFSRKVTEYERTKNVYVSYQERYC
jgi:hypothetical protein